MEIKHKTLEELENDFWQPPAKGEMSNVIIQAHRLRKIPITQFLSEDFRLMISQNIGLAFLVPSAMEILKKNILEDSTYYPGDLLIALLNTDPKFWAQNLYQKQELLLLLSDSKKLIENSTEINNEIRNEIINTILKFNTK